jgi:signal transduction histidine kinase
VLDHGGDMWVESAQGHGARFSFRLPGAHVTQAQGMTVR